MKLERLQTVQRLPIQTEEAWNFFTDPKNLRQITPPWLDVRLTSEAPEYLYPGSLISYDIRPVPGLSMQWISEITTIRPPHFYVTEQRFGPFKLWHHEHHFRDHEDGVEIEDVVTYGLYLGPIGSLMHDFFVRNKLHEIFTHRARALEQQFGSVRRTAPKPPPQQVFPPTQQPVPQRPNPQAARPQNVRRQPPAGKPVSPSGGQHPDRPITLEDIFKPEDD